MGYDKRSGCGPMSLTDRVKVGIDELRMQMLGAQVLFGFQLRGTFEDGFDRLSTAARIIDAVALASIVFTAAALIAAPAYHRIVEKGDASRRLLQLTRHLASIGLFFLATTIGCDGFIVAEYYFGTLNAALAGTVTMLAAFSAWFGVGVLLKRKHRRESDVPMFQKTGLHEKIRQLLTEARVVLPGVQGIFGFQLVITMTDAFERLPVAVRVAHFFALTMMGMSIILLIAPVAIHRLGYDGSDNANFQVLGSRLLAVALAPLMIGMAADFYVAVGKMLGYSFFAALCAVSIFLILLSAWYLAPWVVLVARSPKRIDAKGRYAT